MFRNSQEIAERQVDQNLVTLTNVQANFSSSSSLSNSNVDKGSFHLRENDKSMYEIEGLSPLIFEQMEAAVRHKYQIYRLRVEEQETGSNQRRSTLEQLEGRMLR